jgi:hypothetical protein
MRSEYNKFTVNVLWQVQAPVTFHVSNTIKDGGQKFSNIYLYQDDSTANSMGCDFWVTIYINVIYKYLYSRVVLNLMNQIHRYTAKRMFST